MARQTTYRRRRTSSAQAISPSASPAYRQGLERTSAGVASPSDAIDVRSKCHKNCWDAAAWGTFKHDGSGHREAQWRDYANADARGIYENDPDRRRINYPAAL